MKKKNRDLRRKFRIKKKIKSNKGKFRLCINRSNSNFYAQIIDDQKGQTLLGISTLNKEFSGLKNRSNKEAAKSLGKAIAEQAINKKIENVVFDRNGYLFHGKIKAFVDSATENGLKFRRAENV
ncbi:50S ribosomal protein L18 [Candidatus Woesearchaeota archaeon]|nr:50S ribosomal protein L18 [Candidatus Woesearchaeota archaeon]